MPSHRDVQWGILPAYSRCQAVIQGWPVAYSVVTHSWRPRAVWNVHIVNANDRWVFMPPYNHGQWSLEYHTIMQCSVFTRYYVLNATGHSTWNRHQTILGVVSQTFRELSKIISRKCTAPEITFMVRISSWNFVRVPMALGTRTKFQLEILTRSTISTIYIFRDNCLESSRNVNETPPPLNIMSAKATDITDFDNSLSLVSCQAIIWTNDDLLLIASLGKNKWKLNKCAPIPNQENWF